MPESSLKPEIFLTADGSPTLRLAREDGYREDMHHRGGALTESLFIYGEALKFARARKLPLRILSLGLGLAYNELITLAAASESVEKIWSFERRGDLREAFRRWAQGQGNSVLDDVATRVAAHFRLSLGALRARVGRSLAEGQLELRAEFPDHAMDLRDISVVYYDAFSNKMDRSLWQKDMLVHHFGPRLSPKAVFSTYAATGELNRALQALGFCREKKSGFMKRRQSTLALRLPPDGT